MCNNTERETMSNQNKYALVIAVAKRARQITEKYSDGKEILIEKPVLLASDEFKANKYFIKESDSDDK